MTKTLILIFQSKKLGREANEAEVYIDTHTKKDGSMVDDFSREVVVCNCFLYSFISFFFFMNGISLFIQWKNTGRI